MGCMMDLLRAADKECTRCGCWKPLGDFHLNRATRDGRQSICKVCRNTEAANRRAQRDNPAQGVLAANAYRPWLTVEETLLSRNYERKGPVWCAARVGRSADAVKWHWMAMRRRAAI